MSTLKLNWPTILAVVSGLAGVAGSVLTPIYGTALATQVQVVLQAVAGLLVLIAGYHATTVTAANATARATYRLADERAAAQAPPAG